jgi:hypothetical protein
MILSSKYYSQLRVILLDGVTFGGFNVVDIQMLYENTSIPVVVITRSLPDFDAIKKALENVVDSELRFSMIKKAGPLTPVDTGGPSEVYIQCAGITPSYAAKLVKRTSLHSSIPEPIRVAHLIATAMVLGESSGKA